MKMNLLLMLLVFIKAICCSTSISNSEEDIFAMCTGAGLKCEFCLKCFPGGWCIKNPGADPQCICQYGWTGPNAKFIPDTENLEWGRNRIRADNCLKPCHYTHDVRNATCVESQSDTPRCHEKCVRKTGVCMENGSCRCVRGWTGPEAKYTRSLDRYVATYCDKECPYLGYGIPNPGCDQKLRDIPPCNLLCRRNDGMCIAETGKCLCPLGWTGPGASYGSGIYDGRILADYCLVSCSYTDTRRNDRCINADYIRRLQLSGHITG